MYKKILYPTDFSETAELVIPHLEAFRELGGEEVVLLHVVEEKKKKSLLSMLLGFILKSKEELEKDIENKLINEAKEKLDDIKSKLEELGYNVKGIIVVGSPHSKIVEIAENEDVDIIIMGSHGETNLKEILMGSVTEHVIKNTSKPVLIINRK
ncbi:universal stress protein [Methanocaldococcus indicus]|uniref:universal stress protein n=1 Tax=Methanocaldococcus indicus TaxID=213231 RepID=UPI003C6D7A7D